MEITIKEKEDRPLFGRTDVTASIVFEGTTPSRREVVAGVAKATGAKKELVIVRSITTNYGTTTGTVAASVYKDEQAMAVEHESMRKRHVFEEPKKEEAPAEKAEAQENSGEKPEAPEKADAPEEKPADAEQKGETKEEAPAEKAAEAEKKEGD